MESLESIVVQKQTAIIGQLTTSLIEMEVKLQQAIATAQAFQEELEVLKNGDTKQSKPDVAGRKESDTERV